MARPLRLEAEGCIYHVIARGNERKAVFRDDVDRKSYLERLIGCRERFGLRILAFCFLDNHLHLAVESGPVRLSRVMLALQSAYTQKFNRRHRRVGHLFQGRYKCFLVERDRYLLGLVRYIHQNPVKAGLVDRADRFAWSTDRYYRRGDGPEWLDLDRVLPLLGRSRRAAIAGYRRLMGESEVEPYGDVRPYGQVVKGDKEFAARVLRSAGHPEHLILELEPAEMASAVAAKFDLSVEALRGTGRHREASLARSVAGYLGRRVGRIPVARMAKYFRREESTLVRGVLRLEDRIGRDAELKETVDQLEKALRRS